MITVAAIRLKELQNTRASANYEALLALIVSKGLNVRYHVGIIATADLLYYSQDRPGFNN